MFSDIRGLFQILDNDGPIARTAPAPYPIIDCEKMSAKGLTCNAVSRQCLERPEAGLHWTGGLGKGLRYCLIAGQAKVVRVAGCWLRGASCEAEH